MSVFIFDPSKNVNSTLRKSTHINKITINALKGMVVFDILPTDSIMVLRKTFEFLKNESLHNLYVVFILFSSNS